MGPLANCSPVSHHAIILEANLADQWPITLVEGVE